MLSIIGLILMLLVGISLGVVGSGGSILTVPILVYFLQVPPILATSYSLFIVGITSWGGLSFKLKEKLVDFQVAFYFGLASILTMFFTRTVLVSKIPAEIAVGGISYSSDFLFMVLFGMIMLLAGFSMLFGRSNPEFKQFCKRTSFDKFSLVLQGSVIGIISGLLGAGGGFLIIPGLILFAKLNTKSAIATSLFLVAINSSVGFLSDYHQFDVMNWNSLMLLGLIAISGVIVGNKMSNRIDGKWLKKVFAIFVLIIAVTLIVVELL